jgi:hypothetical protein
MLHSAPFVRVLLLATAVAAVAVMIALAGGAGAAVHGITPLSPVAGASVPVGKAPIFRMRVKGEGEVWVHVCRSKKRNRSGVICGKLAVGRAGRRGSAFEFKPRYYDFPAFWLNHAGTYYWQAFRVACTKHDCRQEGKVVRFKVG